MATLSKKQAKQLDELFEIMVRTKRSERDVGGSINVSTMYTKAVRLQDETYEYVCGLLYTVRHLQKKGEILELIRGTDTMLFLTDPAINGFLTNGGFYKLYKDERAKRRHPVIKWFLESVIKTAFGKISLWAIVTILFLLLSKSNNQDKYQQQQKQSHPTNTSK